ncbi:MAG: peptidoglycan-binding protein [Nannocystis sp.]|nr:peptidoglycan-binding protein [Nannocystis sp.]
MDFSGGEDDERDEVGDPQRFSDEPWDDLDPEAAVEESDEILSFGNVVLEDSSSFERWLQSALKALVDPRIVVDGELGPRTRTAVKMFQKRAREFNPRGPALAADGIAGRQTIAALEAATGCSASAVKEDDREVASPEQLEASDPLIAVVPPMASATAARGGEIVVRECGPADELEYVITAGGDTVRFRYWTPDWNNYKPFNVSRYAGAKRGLLSDAQILASGYSTSELKILKANALKESGGAFGAINTWDDQIVSWGMAQFAGHAGTLAVLLAELKDDPRSAAAYDRWFAGNGIDVAYGAYPYKDSTRKGWHVVVRAGDRVHTGDDGWKHIRSQPRLIGAFLLAGNDPAIQLGQVLYWRRSFLTRAIGKAIGKLPGKAPGAAVSRFFTAERTLALIVRLHNWMPAYVVPWCDRFLAELAKERADAYDPEAWDSALETAMAEKIAAERKRVKSGSYDTYALDLSRARGSFVASRS